jgi:cytochrome oxidase Cu insertion factor (SCO1/SenC/PrrC family)
MRNRLMIMALAASALVSGIVYAAAQTQQPNVTNASKAAEKTAIQNRLLGEVITIDARSKQLSLKTADGKLVIVTLKENTLYRRVPRSGR